MMEYRRIDSRECEMSMDVEYPIFSIESLPLEPRESFLPSQENTDEERIRDVRKEIDSLVVTGHVSMDVLSTPRIFD